MNVALHPIDSKIPNLALMKLSTYHKQRGDTVKFFNDWAITPDIVYCSVVFSWNKQQALGLESAYSNTKFIYGGSGVDLSKSLDDIDTNIEHLKPDYSLYNIDYSMGFLTRGCIRECEFCIVRKKEGLLKAHSPLDEFLDPSHNKVILLDNNLLAYKEHKTILKDLVQRGLKVDFNQGLDIRLLTEETASLLANVKYYGHPEFKQKTLRFSFDDMKYRTAVEQGIQRLLNTGIKSSNIFFYVLAYPNAVRDAVERVEILKSYKVVPFVMKFNKASTPQLNKLAHWVNHIPYYQCFTFDEYDMNRTGRHKHKKKIKDLNNQCRLS